jgi:hypothetical protein
LITAFQREDDACALSDALSKIRLADTGVMEAALPHLANALESIMWAWFRSTKTKSRGKYLEDGAWGDALKGSLEAIGENIKAVPNADRLIRRVKGANNFGVNERFEHFFAELGLPVGEVELNAISARNKAAHGGTYDRSAYKKLLDRTRAYRTLLHRTMLKIIGWSGSYVDYSTYGFPNRNIDEPLGGPEGDGKPA